GTFSVWYKPNHDDNSCSGPGMDLLDWQADAWDNSIFFYEWSGCDIEMRTIWDYSGVSDNAGTTCVPDFYHYGWKANVWHHLAFTWSNSTGHAKAYDNGVLMSDVSCYVAPVGTSNLYVLNGTPNGTVDEFLIFNKALSDSDVNALYQQGLIAHQVSRSTNSGSWTPQFSRETVLTDDFSDGDYTANPVWNVGSGTWAVTNGAVRTSASTANATLLSSKSFAGNYEFSTDVNFNATSVVGGLVFNALDANNNYTLVLREKTSSSPDVQFYKVANNVYTALSTVKANGTDVFTSGNSYNVKVAVNNSTNSYTFFVNNSPIGLYTDANRTSGSIGFYSNSATQVYFDNANLTLTLSDTNYFSDNNAADINASSIPTGVSVSSPTVSSLDVNWTASTDAGTDYNYSIKALDYFGNYTADTNSNTTVTSGVKQYWVQDLNNSNLVYGPYSTNGATVTGLLAGTQHCFQVRAQDFADNNSGLSSQACAFTLSAPVTQVDYNSTHALNSGLGTMRLYWSAVTGATSYDVWRSSDYNVNWQKLASSVTTRDYNDLSVTDNNTLFYKVTAHDGADINSSIDANITVDRTGPAASADLNVLGSPPDINAGVGYAGVTGGLVGFWRFEDLNADTNKTSDLSGNGNSGALTNFACNSLDCNINMGWVSAGKIGKGVKFYSPYGSGLGQYMLVNNSPSLNFNGQFSFTAWVKPGYNGAFQTIIAKNDYSGDYWFEYDNTGSAPVEVRVNNQSVSDTNCSVSAYQGSFVHLAFTVNGTNVIIYRNGVKCSSGKIASPLVNSSNPIKIGAVSSNYNMNGAIDEVKLFNRALSAQEIAADYNAGLARKSSKWASVNWQEPTDAGSLPIDANTVGYWRFQEGSGTTAND
ncbi:MAG: hypothetical protein HZC29_08240, partial [Thaumarchaeota archaeon]|nr:hypothetical protein [Nitrososphaerota archaeon]